jgi:hypothetical protein
MPLPTQQELRRYATLVAAAISTEIPFEPTAEGATAVQVERGTIFPLALAQTPHPREASRVERLIALAGAAARDAAPGALATVAVVDRSGHHRPEYRPLLIYAWLQAFRVLYETLPRMEFSRWDEALRAWCDLLEAELTHARLPDGAIPAARGGFATESAWAALALYAAGKLFVRDAWTDLASDTFGRLTRGQGETGAFLAAGSGDSPEVTGYHELALLHAAASYAVQAEDRTIAAAVARATEFHQRETQPDHATSQPWALFAFVWNVETRPLADQLLHAAAVQQPAGADGVTLILLADALYCLRLFEGEPLP